MILMSFSMRCILLIFLLSKMSQGVENQLTHRLKWKFASNTSNILNECILNSKNNVKRSNCRLTSTETIDEIMKINDCLLEGGDAVKNDLFMYNHC